VVSQHWSARQSAAERHPATHLLSLQMGVLPPQSELPQQAPATQLAPQHFWPLPHWASVVHWQLAVPHCFVVVLQHWFARQSLFEWQQAVHEPLVQQSEEGQSESAQQAALVHAPPQHFSPVPHWASDVHGQFDEPQVCVATSQHWFARQSVLEQQSPGTHWRTDAPASPPAGAPSAPRVPPSSPGAAGPPSGLVPGSPAVAFTDASAAPPAGTLLLEQAIPRRPSRERTAMRAWRAGQGGGRLESCAVSYVGIFSHSGGIADGFLHRPSAPRPRGARREPQPYHSSPKGHASHDVGRFKEGVAAVRGHAHPWNYGRRWVPAAAFADGSHPLFAGRMSYLHNCAGHVSPVGQQAYGIATLTGTSYSELSEHVLPIGQAKAVLPFALLPHTGPPSVAA